MQADFSLDYDMLTVERPQKLYLMARFEAGHTVGLGVRRPLNLSLVIDRSGSMAGDKIDYTKQAAQFLVQHLSSQDTLSVVLYNDKVETLIPPETISNKDMVNQALDRIRVRGTTNLSGGWLEGCRHVRSAMAETHLNRVILMSDGLANRGVTDMATLVGMAQQKRDEGISTTTMGLGNDFNEDLMMEMASAGGGAFYFIESPEVAPLIFHEELRGLLSVMGQNLSISVEPTAEVSMVRQLNAYPMQTTGRSTAFNLGDIFAEEVKTLVLELTIPALAQLGEQRIANLVFEYDEIVGKETRHQRKEVPVMIKVQAAEAAPPLPDARVLNRVLLLKAAQARQNAVKAADQGHYSKATEFLRRVATEIEKAQLQNSPELQEEYKALLDQAKTMDRGAEGYSSYNRKTMSTQAFYTMTSRHDDTMMLRKREQARDDRSRATQEADALETDFAVDSSPAMIERHPGLTPTVVKWGDKTFQLRGDMIRIGRSPHNEIIIHERGVSRFHGQIIRDAGKLYLEDLGSTNGTRVNGILLADRYELSVGDIVYLCDEKLVFGDGSR